MRNYEQWINRLAGRVGLQISRSASAANRLPAEVTESDSTLIDSLRPFTMTSAQRLWTLLEAVRYVTAECVPGDFVECGVWRGGSVMAMARELHALDSTDRRLWLYDTFEGMTQPTDEDVEAASGIPAQKMLDETPVQEGNNVWCIAGRADVERNVFGTGYPSDQFIFVEGDVGTTLNSRRPESIALLRLDTDWYASTRKSLETLYPLLSVGGVCILDDYGHWQGARQAVDEYFGKTYGRPFMHPIDYSGRVFIKPPSHS